MNLKYCFFLLCVLSNVVMAQQVEIPPGWSDGYAYANGIRIHYYRAVSNTDKPVIVMVHGVTDNGLCWTTLTWKLEEHFDIYMLDARGHGLTDPFTEGDSGETLIKDVVQFVQVMNLKDPILIGHSMGAATVMRVGAEYPNLAKAIIMLDPMLHVRVDAPSPKEDSKSDGPKLPVTLPKTSPNHISINMFGSPEVLVAQNNYSFDDLLTEGHRRNPLWDKVDVKYWALSKKQYHGPYSTEDAEAMRGTMNIGNSLSRIKVPAMILKADASPEVRKSHEVAAALMPNGKLIHIEGAGHNLHHDKLERTAELIKQFLAGL